MPYTNEDCDRQMEAYKKNLAGKEKEAAEREKKIDEVLVNREEWALKMQKLNDGDDYPLKSLAAKKSIKSTETSGNSGDQGAKQEDGDKGGQQVEPHPARTAPVTDEVADNPTNPSPKRRRGTRPTGKRPSSASESGKTGSKGTRPLGKRPPLRRPPLSAKNDSASKPTDKPDSKDGSDTGYEVGYGKPPRRTQFKKGRSGNPAGRPKGSKNFKTDLSEELQDRLTVRQNGRTITVSKQRAVIKRLFEKALQGDQRAMTLVINMVGKFIDQTDEIDDFAPLPDEDEAIIDAFLNRFDDKAGQNNTNGDAEDE